MRKKPRVHAGSLQRIEAGSKMECSTTRRVVLLQCLVGLQRQPPSGWQLIGERQRKSMPCQPAQTASSRRMATPSANSAPDPTPYLSGISPGTIPTCTTPLINYAEARLGGGQDSPGCLRPDTPRLEDMWGVPRMAVAHQRADSLHACPQPGRAAVKLVGIIFSHRKISVRDPCLHTN